MSAKNEKPVFDQIPHIVLNHPNMTGDHVFIFIRLYKILKDLPFCTYSNKKISELTRLSLRTIDRKLNDLEVWLIIERIGEGYNRKIKLGLIFNNCAKYDGKKPNNYANMTETSAKNDMKPCKIGVHTKKKLITNNKNDFSYQEYVGRIKSDIDLNLIDAHTDILTYDEWLGSQ